MKLKDEGIKAPRYLRFREPTCVTVVGRFGVVQKRLYVWRCSNGIINYAFYCTSSPKTMAAPPINMDGPKRWDLFKGTGGTLKTYMRGSIPMYYSFIQSHDCYWVCIVYSSNLRHIFFERYSWTLLFPANDGISWPIVQRLFSIEKD